MNNLLGQRFGRLTVIGESEKRDKEGKIFWLCRCDCGNMKEIRAKSLKSGDTKSCGCYRKEINKENLLGQRFGRLIVIGESELRNKHKKVYWFCTCDCGNKIEVLATSLKSGNTLSCGCYQKEKVYEIGKANKENLLGQKFGHLTVIAETENKSEYAYWLCHCDCGNEKEIMAKSLKSGDTTSCGCLNSKMNEKVSKWLTANNVKFQAEYQMPGFRLRFDFMILDENDNPVTAIECQGQQHYSTITFGASDEQARENRISQKKRDRLKRIYCKHNGIKLIELPYWYDLEEFLKGIMFDGRDDQSNVR